MIGLPRGTFKDVMDIFWWSISKCLYHFSVSVSSEFREVSCKHQIKNIKRRSLKIILRMNLLVKQIIYYYKMVFFRARIVLLDGISKTCMPGHIMLESLCYFNTSK